MTITKRHKKAIVLGLAALALLVWGGAYRFHLVRSLDLVGNATLSDVPDPMVIQATCIGGVTRSADGVLEGEPASWGDTAGKACPT